MRMSGNAFRSCSLDVFSSIPVRETVRESSESGELPAVRFPPPPPNKRSNCARLANSAMDRVTTWRPPSAVCCLPSVDFANVLRVPGLGLGVLTQLHRALGALEGTAPLDCGNAGEAVLGKGDIVILKKIEAPDRREVQALARKVRSQARKPGVKRSDIKKAVRASRRRG